MRILALETSSSRTSVAACQDGELIEQVLLPAATNTARLLAPSIRDLLARQGWKPSALEGVAVSLGPGSFTGLRLGVMTAKTLAYAAQVPVVGIDTFQVVAERAEAERVTAVIDAQRGELYVASLQRDAKGPWVVAPPQIETIEVFLRDVNPRDTINGPALVKLATRLPSGASFAPSEQWFPDAATVGQLAQRAFALGQKDDLWKLAPIYLRRSAAEETWSARGEPS